MGSSSPAWRRLSFISFYLQFSCILTEQTEIKLFINALILRIFSRHKGRLKDELNMKNSSNHSQLSIDFHKSSDKNALVRTLLQTISTNIKFSSM